MMSIYIVWVTHISKKEKKKKMYSLIVYRQFYFSTLIVELSRNLTNKM